MQDEHTYLRCRTCNETKHRDAFYPRKNTRSGRRYVCKECTRADLSRRPRRQTREEDRAKRLAFHFGITIAQYDAMVAEQAGKCAICGADRNENGYRLEIDHDHTTGLIRGLLCGSCNRALGAFRDDPGLLGAAMAYVADPPALNVLPPECRVVPRRAA